MAARSSACSSPCDTTIRKEGDSENEKQESNRWRRLSFTSEKRNRGGHPGLCRVVSSTFFHNIDNSRTGSRITNLLTACRMS
jgi:hypothetical protein